MEDIVTLYHPDEFCRTCYGRKGFREPSGYAYGSYTFTPCDACNGTGWRPGAKVEAGK